MTGVELKPTMVKRLPGKLSSQEEILLSHLDMSKTRIRSTRVKDGRHGQCIRGNQFPVADQRTLLMMGWLF